MCVAVCCSVLQWAAVCCRVLHCESGELERTMREETAKTTIRAETTGSCSLE